VLMVVGYRRAAYVGLWASPGWTVHLNNLLMVISNSLHILKRLKPELDRQLDRLTSPALGSPGPRSSIDRGRIPGYKTDPWSFQSFGGTRLGLAPPASMASLGRDPQRRDRVRLHDPAPGSVYLSGW